MKKLLITRTVPQECLDTIKEEFEVIMPDSKKKMFSKDEVVGLVADCDALMTIASPCDKEVLDAAKKLKVVGNHGVGYDNIDWKYATEKKVAVVNAPTTVTEATAELAVGLMLAVMRSIPAYDRQLRRDGIWAFDDLFASPATRVYGSRLGIIGFGRIGKAFAKKAAGLGMEITYYDPLRASTETEKEYNATYLSMEELLKTADVVTMHLPYMPETHHLMGAEQFAMMKPSAYFINAARGPIVHEEALVAALKNGVIKGAGLDVFEFEPKISEGLLGLDNVVLTPHVGTYTWQVRVEMANEALRGICGVLAGEKPYNVVNPTVL